MKNGNLQPVPFEDQNVTFTAPGCGDLPAFRNDHQIITCWELTDEQLQDLLENRRIWLSVGGQAQPPVWITTEYPFSDTTPWPEYIDPTS